MFWVDAANNMKVENVIYGEFLRIMRRRKLWCNDDALAYCYHPLFLIWKVWLTTWLLLPYHMLVILSSLHTTLTSTFHHIQWTDFKHINKMWMQNFCTYFLSTMLCQSYHVCDRHTHSERNHGIYISETSVSCCHYIFKIMTKRVCMPMVTLTVISSLD